MVNIKKKERERGPADRKNERKAKVEKKQRTGRENDICNHKFGYFSQLFLKIISS